MIVIWWDYDKKMIFNDKIKLFQTILCSIKKCFLICFPIDKKRDYDKILILYDKLKIYYDKKMTFYDKNNKSFYVYDIKKN